jgi:HEPN domain-containing protein
MYKSNVDLRAASEHIDAANAAFRNNNWGTAVTEALSSAEIICKGVLKKAGKYDSRPERFGGDQHHKIPLLAQKIKDEHILPSDTCDTVVVLSARLDRIDFTSPQGDYADCVSGQVGDLRYPVGDSTPNDLIKEDDARDKIELAQQIIDILEPYFST